MIAFSLIKSSDCNELTKEDLGMFLKDNGYDPSDADLQGIFTRLDHNKDGRLTYSDFCEIYDDSLLGEQPIIIPPQTHPLRSKNCSSKTHSNLSGHSSVCS